MKHLANILTMMLLGRPALIVGYACAAIRSGFSLGAFIHAQHEVAAIKRFVNPPP